MHLVGLKKFRAELVIGLQVYFANINSFLERRKRGGKGDGFIFPTLIPDLAAKGSSCHVGRPRLEWGK